MFKKMKETNYNANAWYDRQPEPNRLLYFMGLIIVGYIPSVVLIFCGISGDLVTVLPTLLLLPFGIARFIYLT